MKDKDKSPENPYELTKEQKKQAEGVVEYMKMKAEFVYELLKQHQEQEKEKKERMKQQQAKLQEEKNRDKVDRDRHAFDFLGPNSKIADKPMRSPGSSAEIMSRIAK